MFQVCTDPLFPEDTNLVEKQNNVNLTHSPILRYVQVQEKVYYSIESSWIQQNCGNNSIEDAGSNERILQHTEEFMEGPEGPTAR